MKPMKKSENVEIRIDHKTKQALADKAAIENRNVSEVLRDLIHEYLTPAAPLKDGFRFRSYGGWLTAAMVIMFSGLSLIPGAAADSLKLGFHGEVIKPEEDGQRLHSAQYEIKLDSYSEPVSLPIGSDKFIFEIFARPVELETGEDAVHLKIKIIEKGRGHKIIVAEPQLTTLLGEEAKIEIGGEDASVFKAVITSELVDD